MSQPAEPVVQEHHHLFDTGLGTCGIAWSARGLTRLQLPERNRRATEGRLKARSAGSCASVPPAAVRHTIAALQRYCAGESVDFSGIDLDLGAVGPFQRRIYAAMRSLGWGQTATYGDLARLVGSPGAARAVGRAMGHNPVPIVIPCHRVLASGGKIGGFSAFGGAVTKERLLALEGVHVGSGTPLLPGLLPAGR